MNKFSENCITFYSMFVTVPFTNIVNYSIEDYIDVINEGSYIDYTIVNQLHIK